MPLRQSTQINISPPKSNHVTPSKIRRRQNGSPITPIDPTRPTKTIYLIRHGQSQGQVAKQNGLDRLTDPRLRDCGLTMKGLSDAANLEKQFTVKELREIQLVVSSPLTRAFHTALVGFPTKDIMVNFDLREIGLKAPENTPRAINEVVRDLEDVLSCRDKSLLCDFVSLQPKEWPRDYSPRVIQIDRIQRVFKWLYETRQESVIAVVCHYNVIRSAVTDCDQVRPMNAVPIRCTLYSNGDLVVDASKTKI